MGGNANTGSYNSAVSSTTVDSGGNLGTNGNLDIQGSVSVHGSLSSPRAGVGTCVNGSNVTALTEQGRAATYPPDNLVSLPQPLNFETPALPSPMPPTTPTNTCAQITALTSWPSGFATCNTIGGVPTIDPNGMPIVLGNVTGNIKLLGGEYTINSISGGDVSVGPSSAMAGVTINLAGKTSSGTDMAEPFDQTGNTIVNNDPKLDSSLLQILYAGTGKFDMHGGAKAAFVLYAPNASLEMHGNGDIYGSVLVKTVTQGIGSTNFYYDKKLDATAFTMGNYVMSSFSWKKY
jgi:hypothetical protein